MNNHDLSRSNLKLADLIDMTAPQQVLNETRFIATSIIPSFDFRPLSNLFYDIKRLFEGEFPGYRACSTEYHNFQHTTDTFVALIRIMHGWHLNGNPLTERQLYLGLIAALMHDTGFIQAEDDVEGTGAKYTLEHITRSIAFAESYLSRRGFPREDIEFIACCLPFTGFDRNEESCEPASDEQHLTGAMLGTSDLLGQTADRMYLEKLLFLFYEFKEGHVLGYETELDLLRKTIGFYEGTRQRLDGELDGLYTHLDAHFKERWGAARNLYLESMDKNIDYLEYLLANHEQDYRNYLRRGDILKKLYQQRKIS